MAETETYSNFIRHDTGEIVYEFYGCHYTNTKLKTNLDTITMRSDEVRTKSGRGVKNELIGAIAH